MPKRTIKISEGIDYHEIGGLVKRLVHPETTGSENIAVSICYINPGEEIIHHKHEYEEVYFILEGKGKMILEGEEIKLKKFLSVYIPANAEHGQKNTGNEPLILLCALTPPPQINS